MKFKELKSLNYLFFFINISLVLNNCPSSLDLNPDARMKSCTHTSCVSPQASPAASSGLQRIWLTFGVYCRVCVSRSSGRVWASLVVDLHRMQNDMKLPAEQRRKWVRLDLKTLQTVMTWLIWIISVSLAAINTRWTDSSGSGGKVKTFLGLLKSSGSVWMSLWTCVSLRGNPEAVLRSLTGV